GVMRDGHVKPAARDRGIDEIAHARLELGEFARQIHDHVALLPVHGIEFDAEFTAVVHSLAVAVAGHASHGMQTMGEMAARDSTNVGVAPSRLPARPPANLTCSRETPSTPCGCSSLYENVVHLRCCWAGHVRVIRREASG